jgi:hypothetical protein
MDFHTVAMHNKAGRRMMKTTGAATAYGGIMQIL